MTNKTVGIDFGTTNTYVTFGNSEDPKQTLALQIDGKTAHIPTVILYSDNPAVNQDCFPVIGRDAEDTFGECDAQESKNKQYRYNAVFKPDIDKSPEAYRCAVDFLTALLRDAGKKSHPINPKDRRVIFGVPCEATAQWKEGLKQAAVEAGFGEIETLEEPKGALISDLKSNLFNIRDIIQGHLVVDFGGGTCDFTFFRNGEIVHSWGDMSLGGRLLDDLFYQWFSGQHPVEAAEVERIGSDFFVLTCKCRELKEWFSDKLASDPDFNGRKSIFLGELPKSNPNCRMTDLSKNEFLRRAKDYIPSEAYKRFLNQQGRSLPARLTDNKPTDIIAWFQDCLKSGLHEKGISIKDIKVVSAAGGSSRWFFVKEFCCESLLFGDESRFLQSPQPYAAISEGLAAYPAMKRQFEETKQKIVAEKPGFLQKEILPSVISEIEMWEREVIEQDIMCDVFDNTVKPVLEQFRQTGGTMKDLQNRIENATKKQETQIIAKIRAKGLQAMTRISDTAFNKVQAWLRHFNLNAVEIVSPTMGTIDIGQNRISGTGLDDFMTDAAAMVALIAGMIGASVCGGTGMALILAGPGGLIIGFILALLAAGPLLIYGRKVVQEWIENNVPIPAVVTNNFVLKDAAIVKMRENTKTSMLKKLNEIAYQQSEFIIQQLDKVIQDEIDRLSVINVQF